MVNSTLLLIPSMLTQHKPYSVFTTFVKYSAIFNEYRVNIARIFVSVVNSSYICCRTINCSVMAESAKRARFTKVASARVTKIINYLNLLQNCSNRNNYEYDSEDVELMFAEIGKVLRDAKAAYSNELYKQTGKGGFSFKK